MKKSLFFLIFSLFILSFPAAEAGKLQPGQQVGTEAVEELAVDDGTFEESVGRGDGSGTFIAVNRLTPTHYPATLSQVAVYFRNRLGSPPLGTPITILVAANPNGGTGINGLTFQSTAATVKALGEFNVYDVPSVAITSGDFVAGFQIAQQPDTLPVAIDLTPPSQGRSYYSTIDTSIFVPHDLAVPRFTGNYGIRARLASPATNPAFDAHFVSGVLPSVVAAGQTFGATLTFTNTGTQTWASGAGTSFALVSQNPAFNQTWGVSSISLASFQIAPGQQLILNFTVTAPSTPGTYSFQWQLYQNGGAGFFGQVSSNATIQVVAATNQPVISAAVRQGKHLLVTGMNFVEGTKILLNGEQQKTIFDTSANLIGKKVGKKIASGDHLKVRNPDGVESNEFIYP